MRTPRATPLITAEPVEARAHRQPLDAWVRTLPPLFFSDSRVTSDVSAAKSKGLLRKVKGRLYTTDLNRPLEQLVRTNALAIAALRCPGCVLSHRSALERRAVGGVLFLTGPKTRYYDFPGLRLNVREGPGRLVGDTEFLSLSVASTARACLENLAYTRASSSENRSLSSAELEAYLEHMLATRGEDVLLRLRDDARELVPLLGAEQEGAEAAFATLDGLIGALLGTRQDVPLATHSARARRAGHAYDREREMLFAKLVAELQNNWADVSRPRSFSSGAEQHLAFIDAYFSNYIEGTKFETDEAAALVFEHKLPVGRSGDAHDIVGTYNILISPREMMTSVTELASLDELEFVLKQRHATLLAARPDMRPGQFKRQANRAGATSFVAPELVRGTLQVGLAQCRQLETPFSRAVFIMFMISEIHPFDDGNGRLARIMMNAELAAAGEQRILVPTVYRHDYLTALRVLSRDARTHQLPLMLDYAQEFSARLDYRELAQLLATLTSCDAFDDSLDRRLKLPLAKT